MNNLHEKLQQAFGRFNARDLAGTERLCGEILGAEPRHPDALHLLGVVHMVSGRPQEAASLIGRALEVSPRDAAMQENLGMAWAALGDYVAAEAAFRKALDLGAAHAQLHMRLGMALAAQGRVAEAEPVLRIAAGHASGDPDIQLNLGNVLAGLGRAEEALACFRNVAALRPQHPDAHFNLGTLFSSMGRHQDALAAFRKARALDPMNADVHNNLGLVHGALGQGEEAVACFRKAVAIDPNHAHAHSNLGNALRVQGRMDEAAAACERALALAPRSVDALINLGNVRAGQQRLAQAQALHEQALKIDPRATEAHRNLGALFRAQGRLREALTSYRVALGLAPNQAAVHAGLGGVLRELGDLEAALTAFQKAVEIDSQSAWLHFDLAETLKVMGRLDDAAAHYRRTLELEPNDTRALGALVHVRQHMCSWDGIEASWERLRNAISADGAAGVSPFSTLSLPTTASEQLAGAKAWAQRELAPYVAARSGLNFTVPTGRRGERLRVGYLSWGFHQHATAYLVAELFELHDRSRFEIYAYACGPDDGSAIRSRIRGACEHFADVSGEDYFATARRIHQDGVDILVDLTGYTLGARTAILALRPAPVQVNWLGYPGTMGTDCVDYLIADPYVIPPGEEVNYTEKVLRLPHCYQINDRRRRLSERVPSREEYGLPAGGIVFCCFNQAYKILPETFGLWMRIVGAVPGSVLWLAQANPWASENLKRAAVALGIAAERIVFTPRKPHPDYLVQYRQADLALDTFPYTSHTTASDALWMGCPLVARVGETFASRVAGSVLRSAGLPELITDSPAQYEALAIELATTPDMLLAIRRKLNENRDSCPLFDTPRFVRDLERAYEDMFRTLDDGKA